MLTLPFCMTPAKFPLRETGGFSPSLSAIGYIHSATRVFVTSIHYKGRNRHYPTVSFDKNNYKMKRIIILIVAMLFTAIQIFAQGVGIGTTDPDPSALLELKSTTKGFMPPRITAEQKINLTTRIGDVARKRVLPGKITIVVSHRPKQFSSYFLSRNVSFSPPITTTHLRRPGSTLIS